MNNGIKEGLIYGLLVSMICGSFGFILGIYKKGLYVYHINDINMIMFGLFFGFFIGSILGLTQCIIYDKKESLYFGFSSGITISIFFIFLPVFFSNLFAYFMTDNGFSLFDIIFSFIIIVLINVVILYSYFHGKEKDGK